METETNNEFGDETNQRLVESGTSAKLVGTSVRLVGDDFCMVARQKQIQTGCELSVSKSLVCECGDRLVIKQFPYSRGKERCPGMNSSIQMSDETCLMSVHRKSRNFDPTTVECCSSVDLSAEDTQE